MKKKIAICFMLLFMASLVDAQSCFEKVFRNFSTSFYMYGSVATSDSGLVMISYNSYNGVNNIFKVNVSGQTEWLIAENDSVSYLKEPIRVGNKIYFMGLSAYPRSKPSVLAMNEDGLKLWSTELIADSGYACSITDLASDGNNLYLTAAFAPGSNWNLAVPGLICLDTLGNISWVKRYSAGGRNNAITYNPSRNEFVIIGSDGVYSYMHCIDPNGNMQWSKSIDIMFYGSVSAIVPDVTGNGYYLSGNYYNDEPIVLKIDAADGNLIWCRQVYLQSMVATNTICALPDGGFCLGAFCSLYASVIRFSDSGNVIGGKELFNNPWTYQETNSVAYICPNSWGGLWITGHHVASASFQELFCIAADSTGFTGCQTDIVATDSAYTMVFANAAFQSQPDSMRQRSIIDDFYPASMTQQLLCVSAVGITESNKHTVSVFPNPAASRVNFQFGENAAIRTIQIFDVQGRELFNQMSTENTVQIPVADLPSGIYHYRIGSQDSETVFGKFIVE